MSPSTNDLRNERTRASATVHYLREASGDGVENGGGGGHDGGMEARVAKLEAIAESTDRRISLVETDIRALASKVDRNFVITWGGLIGLALLIAKGFHWIG